VRALVLAAAVLAALALTAARAGADADPPSDVLLIQDSYYPYNPPASKAAVTQLDALIATARRRGFPVRVAMIATRSDLGAIPDLFGRPQRYAAFLEQEISFNARRPLLVVMPGGYGVAGVPASASRALEGLPAPGNTGDDLARAAVLALPKLAAAAGHRVPAPAPLAGKPGGSGHRGGSSALPIVLPVALLAALGLVGAVRNRRRRAGET
jgi:hypothetical protein